MVRRSVLVPTLVVVLTSSLFGQTPQLVGKGMLATETASRTRLRGDEFHVGDLMYVQVLFPPSNGSFSVSVHMEYKTPDGRWAPVPTTADALGRQYTSGRYPGLRDFVQLGRVTEYTRRHISLFLPYDAAAIEDGTYSRRYVVRIWDQDNRDLARTELSGEMVTVRKQSGRTTMKLVECTACCAVLDGSEGPLKPIPAATSVGSIQFFDASTGRSTCPGAEGKPLK